MCKKSALLCNVMKGGGWTIEMEGVKRRGVNRAALSYRNR